VLEWLHRHATPHGMALGLAVSRAGSPLALTLLALGGALLLAALEEWIVLGGWVAAFGGAGLLDYWLKLVVHRPRPVYAGTLLHHPTWSFPSGHAMGALVGYGMLAYVALLLRRASRRTRVLVVASAALLIGAIGLSRLYLGVHYLTDVVGGYVVGSVWLALCIGAAEWGRRGGPRRWRLTPTT
jgi:undecaprenyl-diphosphatase